MKIFEGINDITGVIHVGAHYGEECEYYKSIGINRQIWIEALQSNFEVLHNKLKGDENILCFNVAIGATEERKEMFLSSNSNESASLLKPALHVVRMPNIKFDGMETVTMTTLDKLLDGDFTCNALVLDIQGYELEALKGATETLKYIKYIWTEVNYEHLYENCVLVNELDDFLSDFKRVHNSDLGGWGDALYIRK